MYPAIGGTTCLYVRTTNSSYRGPACATARKNQCISCVTHVLSKSMFGSPKHVSILSTERQALAPGNNGASGDHDSTHSTESFGVGQEILDPAGGENDHFRLGSGIGQREEEQQDCAAHQSQDESSDGGAEREGRRSSSQKSSNGGEGRHQQQSDAGTGKGDAEEAPASAEDLDTTNTKRPGAHAERGDVVEKCEITYVFMCIRGRCAPAPLLQVWFPQDHIARCANSCVVETKENLGSKQIWVNTEEVKIVAPVFPPS